MSCHPRSLSHREPSCSTETLVCRAPIKLGLHSICKLYRDLRVAPRTPGGSCRLRAQEDLGKMTMADPRSGAVAHLSLQVSDSSSQTALLLELSRDILAR